MVDGRSSRRVVSDSYTAAGGGAPDDFDRAIDQLMAREFEESPVWASLLGVDGYDARLDDCSAEGFGRRSSEDEVWLQRFAGTDPEGLSFDQSIDRALVLAHLGQRVALADWEAWRRSPEGYLETGITELFLLGMRTEDEFTASAVARLRAIGSVLEEAERNLDPALASRLVVERGLAQCVANIGFARNDVAGLARQPANQRRLGEAGEIGARSYERFADFLRRLLPQCTGTFVFGEDRYNEVLGRGELLDLDVDSLRRLGWAEYNRVAGLMGSLADTISGGDEDWPAAVRRLFQRGLTAGIIDKNPAKNLLKAYRPCPTARRSAVLFACIRKNRLTTARNAIVSIITYF